MLKSGLEINSSQLALLCYHLHRSKLAFSCLLSRYGLPFLIAYQEGFNGKKPGLPCIVIWYLWPSMYCVLVFVKGFTTPTFQLLQTMLKTSSKVNASWLFQLFFDFLDWCVLHKICASFFQPCCWSLAWKYIHQGLPFQVLTLQVQFWAIIFVSG